MSQKKTKRVEEKTFEKETDAVIEGLLKRYGATPEGVFGEGGLLKALSKRVLEKALAGELTHHLGYAKGQERPEGAEGNHRTATGT